MAELEITGIDELNDVFARLADIPDEVTGKALEQMGDTALESIRRTGETMGVRDPDSGVHILDKLKRKKPKLSTWGGSVDVTFQGSRTRGGIKTRNAEIAFVNNYGRGDMPPRPFLSLAMERDEEKIVEPGAEIIGDWMEKTFSE